MSQVGKLLFAVMLSWAGAAVAVPLFPQCPPTGVNTGCEFLVTIGPGGAASVQQDPTAPNNGPYDGSEDTLIGVVNHSGVPIASFPISSPANNAGGIMAFDGDGPCTSSPGPTNCSSDPSGYGGPGVFFANIAANHMSGTVVFNPPLADGASAWFALEEVLTLAQITPLAALPAVPPIATPTMSTWAMLLLGGLILLAAGWTLRRRS